jgi:glutaminyl-peptide cyclotransferase
MTRPTQGRKRIDVTRLLLLMLTMAGIVAFGASIAPLGPSEGGERGSVALYDYTVVHVYPHDPTAFTQGLLFREGFLFESTGLNGQSTLRKVRLETGEVLEQRSVDSAFFAEGLTDWDTHLIQLTYRAGIAFVYDLRTLALIQTFRYSGEGWGLTKINGRLVMSDGTSTLRFLDPDTFMETGRINVTAFGEPISNLNELEVVRGDLYANVWPTNEIVIIDPHSGIVTGRIDLAGLLTSADRVRPVDVLNGIAYDSEHDRLFVTGKLWPKLFEIRLKPT